MRPERTLIVDPGELGRGYELHLERYPGARVAKWDGAALDPDDVAWLLDGCDVLYTAETPYDYGLLIAARSRGIRSVVHGNFEFMRWLEDPSLPRPDLFLAPSPWHLERWPQPVAYLPFPVDRSRLSFRHRTQAVTFLHVAGHRAMQDRNGTKLVRDAVRHVRSHGRLILRSQSRIGTPAPYAARPRGFALEVIHSNVPDYWALYEGADVLVLPRRYGGQCLPMNEALSCGLPVVSLDVEPQRRFLPSETLVPAHSLRKIRTQAGPVDWYDASPRAVAQRIDRLAGDPELVARLSRQADEYAAAISWTVLAPVYREVLSLLHEHGAGAAVQAAQMRDDPLAV